MMRLARAIFQHVANKNPDKKPIIVDSELQKELNDSLASCFTERTNLNEDNKIALVITRGPSFIDEYSLRPENHLLELLQTVKRWDAEGIDIIIEQLARNNYFDQDAIERIKKWDNPDGRISNFYWQKIREHLNDFPNIREKMKKNKANLIRSEDYKRFLGLREGESFVVTREMLGKEKLEEIKKELTNLRIVK
jgi:hypothetical protein